MGSASLIVAENKSMAVTLHGAWEETTSQTQIVSIPFSQLVYRGKERGVLGSGHRPSHLPVQIQVPSVEEEAAGAPGSYGKFKLVSLSSC